VLVVIELGRCGRFDSVVFQQPEVRFPGVLPASAQQLK